MINEYLITADIIVSADGEQEISDIMHYIEENVSGVLSVEYEVEGLTFTELEDLE